MLPDRTDILERYKDFPDRDKWCNEAFFGHRQVKASLDALGQGDAVLEVGSGPGILLSLLTHQYPHLSIEGIEPVGRGFHILAPYHAALASSVSLHRFGYEAFRTERRYQFIFLINVFEHLPDWRHFLRFVRERLADNGRCMMLFPNYTFPYEPHFSLPIIMNKAVTHRLFRGAITRYEHAHNCAGYWDSLNFVTYRQVKKACAHIGLAHAFDTDIVRDMLARFHTDSAYRERQTRIVWLAAIVRALRLDRPFTWGALRNFIPYLKLEIRRTEAA